jgi:hypothetical protein
VVTDNASLRPDDVRTWLSIHEEIVHCTIEVNPRRDRELDLA